MQQTNQYQFNLIETSDKFLPGPLNENMEKVEAALTGNMETVQTALAEKARIVAGSYVGTGTYGLDNPCTLTFDFDPMLVIIRGTDYYSVFVRGAEGFGDSVRTGVHHVGQAATWGSKSLSWYLTDFNGSNGYYAATAEGQLNDSGETYHYIAVG